MEKENTETEQRSKESQGKGDNKRGMAEASASSTAFKKTKTVGPSSSTTVDVQQSSPHSVSSSSVLPAAGEEGAIGKSTAQPPAQVANMNDGMGGGTDLTLWVRRETLQRNRRVISKKSTPRPKSSAVFPLSNPLLLDLVLHSESPLQAPLNEVRPFLSPAASVPLAIQTPALFALKPRLASPLLLAACVTQLPDLSLVTPVSAQAVLLSDASPSSHQWLNPQSVVATPIGVVSGSRQRDGEEVRGGGSKEGQVTAATGQHRGRVESSEHTDARSG
eukprot:747961-Hanusia_phi.AAC.1